MVGDPCYPSDSRAVTNGAVTGRWIDHNPIQREPGLPPAFANVAQTAKVFAQCFPLMIADPGIVGYELDVLDGAIQALASVVPMALGHGVTKLVQVFHGGLETFAMPLVQIVTMYETLQIVVGAFHRHPRALMHVAAALFPLLGLSPGRQKRNRGNCQN